MQNKDHISYQVALNIKQAVEEKNRGKSSHRHLSRKPVGDWSQVYDELMMGSIDMAHSSVPETYDARTAVGYFLTFRAAMISLGKYLQKAPLLTI